jgi:hypothetical protein
MMLADAEREGGPPFGSSGEISIPSPEPPSPALGPIVIPPPPWAEQYREDTETYPVKRKERPT